MPSGQSGGGRGADLARRAGQAAAGAQGVDECQIEGGRPRGDMAEGVQLRLDLGPGGRLWCFIGRFEVEFVATAWLPLMLKDGQCNGHTVPSRSSTGRGLQ